MIAILMMQFSHQMLHNEAYKILINKIYNKTVL